MWIFLNDAFVSIVADRHNDKRFLVRARFEGDIERLWPDAEVIVGAGSDYLFRAFLPRQVIVEVLAQRLLSVDYGNFKGSVRDWDRHNAYLGVSGTKCAAPRRWRSVTASLAAITPMRRERPQTTYELNIGGISSPMPGHYWRGK